MRGDGGTLSLLDYIAEVREAADEIEHAAQVRRRPDPACDGQDREAELYQELAGACIQAIRDSGLTRTELVDQTNELYCRPEEKIPLNPPLEKGEGADRKPRLTINMLNNYLAESKRDSRIPVWLLVAICQVTESPAPLRVLADRINASVVSEEEMDELQVGKLTVSLQALSAAKREAIKTVRKRRSQGGGGND